MRPPPRPLGRCPRAKARAHASRDDRPQGRSRTQTWRTWAAMGTVAACLCPWATSASAQEQPKLPAIQLQRFRPAQGPADYLNVYGSAVSEHMDWDLHFFMDYADDPLKIRTAGAGTSGLGTATVDEQLTLSLGGSLALLDRFEVSLLVPVTLTQSSQELQPILLNEPRFNSRDLSAFSLNDWRLNGKWRILDMLEDQVGLALVMGLSLPLALQNRLTSDGGVGFETHAVVDKFLYGGIRGALNAGFRYRPDRRRLRENVIGNEVALGLAFGIPMFFDRLDGIVELDTAIGVASRDEANSSVKAGEVHVELRGALNYKLSSMWSLTFGVGAGATPGVGTPDYRGILGFNGRWVTGGDWGYDYDGDGIYGKRDLCPDQAEDFDGFEDFDGCPDPDNDGDGVPDEQDKCPNTPPDTPVRADGCPDDDLDGDGIPNKYDKCPEDPEDIDGWQDADGCPDTDNDGDGIPDSRDSCPNQPETFNGFLDEDGCPDDLNEKAVVSKDKIIITEPVYFATNKDTILKQSFEILDAVAKILKENPQIKLIRIEGHTDDRGKDSLNMDLSQRRARSVRKYLMGKGVEPNRLESVGYGKNQPIADNETDEGRAKNRRVEFTIVETSQER